MEKKREYVVMQPVGKAPHVAGYDSFLTAWEDFSGNMDVWMEELELGVPASMTFTIYSWTKAEYEAYCEANGIETN